MVEHSPGLTRSLDSTKEGLMHSLDKNQQLEEILAQESVEIHISGGTTLISTVDLLMVLSIENQWRIDKHGYAARSIPFTKGQPHGQRLHNFITGLDYVDHINGDTLDNRRENLRPATHQQNTWNRKLATNNTTGFKGVYRTPAGTFMAQICKDGHIHRLGTFPTAEAAGHAYDDAAVELFGEFAALNFPREGYRCIRDVA